jgi:hypothetical protein
MLVRKRFVLTICYAAVMATFTARHVEFNYCNCWQFSVNFLFQNKNIITIDNVVVAFNEFISL